MYNSEGAPILTTVGDDLSVHRGAPHVLRPHLGVAVGAVGPEPCRRPIPPTCPWAPEARLLVTPFSPCRGFPGEGGKRGRRLGTGTPTKEGLHFDKITLRNRGARAWEQAETEPFERELSGGPTRILARKITDRVALAQYLPAVRQFMGFVMKHRIGTRGVSGLDRSMLRYVNTCCYVDRLGLEHARLAVFAAEWAYPEAGRLELSRNALISWKRFAVLGEGQPVPWEGLTAITTRMAEQGHAESADVCEIAADAYLRSSDRILIRDTDITDSDEHGASMPLGVGERGESVKTGIREGVRIDREGVRQKLPQHKKQAVDEGGGCIFSVSQAGVYAHWAEACESLDCYAGPLHVIRHLGPRCDLLKGYRSLPQVQNSARWAVQSSVARYGKAHIYVRAEAGVPASLKALGAARLKALGSRARLALA